LAIIDGDSTDLKIARFRSLLVQLSDKVGASQQQISDTTVKAREELTKRGVQESLLNIMEGLNQIISQKLKPELYPTCVTTYISLRTEGQSHRQAVATLQGKE
jgi:hypothetical protein